MKKILILLIAAITIVSCKKTNKDGETYLPTSNGSLNHIVVKMPNEDWNGVIGDAIREVFARPLDGVINEEPLYTLQHVAPEAFTKLEQESRNLLVIETNKDTNFEIKENVSAKPQKLIYVSGNNPAEIIKNIRENAEKSIANIRANELAERQLKATISLSKERGLEENLGITLNIPSIYKTVRKEDKFLWIERRTDNGTNNILAYELPANFIPNDSSRVVKIVKLRDSIGKEYIPGRIEGTHMISEAAFAPFVNDDIIDNKPAIETRGRWELKGNFMAGPFINYIVEDKANERQIVIEGFVFAPQRDKRDLLFELEAIIRSLKIK